MSDRIGVVLADANEKFRVALKRALDASGDFFVMADTGSGSEVPELVQQLRPQLLVTDLLLPEMDGLGILWKLKRENIPVKTVVVSALYCEDAVTDALAAGAAFFVAKPCSIASLLDRLRRVALSAANEPFSLTAEVSTLLQTLGVPAHIKGYQYLREAILLAVQNGGYLGGMTKTLYPELARRFGSTAGSVERALRGAIELTWSRGDIETLQHYFGNTVSCTRGKPTNSEFIALLADRIRLRQLSCRFAAAEWGTLFD